MNKLIKLELRKNNLKPYLYSVVGIFIVVVALGILLCAIPALESNNLSSQDLSKPKTLIIIISIISMNAFAILSSVMYSKFIIEEYTGKKNILLFTYPQKRSNILFAKFALVFIFIFMMMFISNIITCFIIMFIGNWIGLISVSFNDLSLILQFSLILAFIVNFIGLIALRVGFYKKSIIAPIITAIILSLPFGNSISLLENNLFIFIITVILLFISALLFWGLLKKVNKMECI